MKIQQVTAEAAMASLNSGQQGLSFDEILRRLGEYGPNRVEEVIHESSVFAVSERIQPFFLH